MSLEQGDRTARIVLELNVMKRREALLRELHEITVILPEDPEDSYGWCYHCNDLAPCETRKILDSTPPVVTEA